MAGGAGVTVMEAEAVSGLLQSSTPVYVTVMVPPAQRVQFGVTVGWNCSVVFGKPRSVHWYM